MNQTNKKQTNKNKNKQQQNTKQNKYNKFLKNDKCCMTKCNYGFSIITGHWTLFILKMRQMLSFHLINFYIFEKILFVWKLLGLLIACQINK